MRKSICYLLLGLTLLGCSGGYIKADQFNDMQKALFECRASAIDDYKVTKCMVNKGYMVER